MSCKRIDWFLDSGASDHMVKDKHLFEELHPLEREVTISVAKSGHVTVAKYAGTIRVDMVINGRRQPSVVHDVLYVPEQQCNLFSVRRLEDNGMTLNISGGKVAIKKDGRLVCMARRMGQLYALDVYFREGMESASECAMAAKTNDELLHRSYGQQCGANPKCTWKHGMIEAAAKIRDWPERCFCEKCLADKRTSQSLDGEERRSSRPFELAHSGVKQKQDPVKIFKSDDEDDDDKPAVVVRGVPGESAMTRNDSAGESKSDDEEEQGEPTGALPSQSKSGNCHGEVTTRQSGRERIIPGKFNEFISNFDVNTGGECFTGIVGAATGNQTTFDKDTAFAFGAEAFREVLPLTNDGRRKKCSTREHWKSTDKINLISLQQNGTWQFVSRPPRLQVDHQIEARRGQHRVPPNCASAYEGLLAARGTSFQLKTCSQKCYFQNASGGG